MHEIVLVFEVDTDWDEDHQLYDLISVRRVSTTLPDNAALHIQEYLAQSDFGAIEFNNGVQNALGTDEKVVFS